MLKSLLRVFTMAILAGCINQGLLAQWPQFRGPMRNGFCSETNLLKEWPEFGPKMVWSIDTIGAGFSSATIEDGIIYTTGRQDSINEIITAIDLNGNLLWQKVYGRAQKGEWPESRSTPTVYRGKVYALSVAGDLACLDSKTGEITWQLPILEKFGGLSGFNGFTESLLVLDDKVIVSPCGPQTTLIALNNLTGDIIWTSEAMNDTNTHTSPVLIEENGKKIIITSTIHNLLAFDFNSGKIISKKNIDYPGIVPLPMKNKFYLTCGRGGLMLEINKENNFSVIWQDTSVANFMGGSVISDNKIFISQDDNNRGLMCIDAETGRVLSRNKEINSGNLLATNEMLYCYEERRGRVCLLKINETGADIVSSFMIKKGTGPHLAHISIANGYMFIRHNNSLMAYDIRG